MAPSNFTIEENEKTVEELVCSAEFTAEVHKELIFVLLVFIVLSITAFLGNTLILVALHKESSLHPPCKLVYRNLAITDLCVGLIVGPLALIYWISVVKKRWDICGYVNLAAGFLAYTLCAMSLFKLTAISVDRLLA